MLYNFRVGRKTITVDGFQISECLAHGADDLHVHVWAEKHRRFVGVWNIGRQRGERGLRVSSRLAKALELQGYKIDQ